MGKCQRNGNARAQYRLDSKKRLHGLRRQKEFRDATRRNPKYTTGRNYQNIGFLDQNNRNLSDFMDETESG